MLRLDSISKKFGGVRAVSQVSLELSDGEKIPIIPTLHPAYLLRAPNQKKLAWEDLKSIRSKLQGL